MVTPKAPFTRPIGKSNTCADEAAVPTWADAVGEALCDAGDEGSEITMQRDDAAARRWALRLSIRSHTLTVCSYWGWDALPLNLLDAAARVVCSQTAQLNSVGF
jgi:hypothetical protein